MQKVMIAILLMVGCSTGANAAMNLENTTTNNPLCPVEVSIFMRPFLWKGIPGEPNLQANFKNSGTKEILGVSFGLDLMDAVGDFRPSLFDLDDAKKVIPGKKSTPKWYSLAIPDNPASVSGRLYVRKVSFTDGTNWTDDGSKACRLVIDWRGI